VTIRNGTMATVNAIDPERGISTLGLDDGSVVDLDARKVTDADIRLAYVQHPFPAQGITTDTSHLIIADSTTVDGSYVALSRAR
jgi:hypothetical protein